MILVRVILILFEVGKVYWASRGVSEKMERIDIEFMKFVFGLGVVVGEEYGVRSFFFRW